MQRSLSLGPQRNTTDSNDEITTWTETTTTYRDKDSSGQFDDSSDPLLDEVFEWTRTFEADPASDRYTWRNETPEGRDSVRTYDGAGRLIKIEYADGRSVEYGYDTATGHLRRRISYGTNGGARGTFLEYDSDGNLLERMNGREGALNHTTTFLNYDALGRLTEFEEPGTAGAPRNIRYDWDRAGNMSTLTVPDRDLDGNRSEDEHVMEYTAAERLDRYEPPPHNTPTDYDYDQDGRLRSVSKNGSTLGHDYNSDGQLSLEHTESYDRVFDYYNFATDGDTRVKSITEYGPSGMTAKLVKEWDGQLLTKLTTEYLANIEHALTQVFYDGDRSLRERTVESVAGGVQLSETHSFDADGLLIGIHDPEAAAFGAGGGFELSRASNSGRVEDTLFNNTGDLITTDHAYNEFGEPRRVSYMNDNAGSLIAEFEVIERDSFGRITHSTETIDGQTSDYQYQYDPAGFLREVWVDGDPQNDPATYTYNYDVNGNRLGLIDESGSNPAEWHAGYDEQDRIEYYACDENTIWCDQKEAPRYEFEYGPYLNLSRRVDVRSGAEINYGYDGWGNLRQIDTEAGETHSYYVDPQNRRIAKHTEGQLIKGWVWAEEDRILAEFDNNGDLVSRFYYATKDHAPDLMYSKKSGSWTWYRIVTDWRGSIRGVYDTAAAQYVQRIDYSPFGRVLDDTNPGFQPFGFAGGLYDPDTELVRFGARDYDPFIGRWTNKDPIRFGGGDTNLYGYVMQDPVNFVDPSGLAAVPMPVPPPPVIVPLVCGGALIVGGALLYDYVTTNDPPSEPEPDDDDDWCRDVIRPMCRAQCSETDLPSYSDGVKYWRCMYKCFRKWGC